MFQNNLNPHSPRDSQCFTKVEEDSEYVSLR